MLNNLKINKILWRITTLLTLVAAFTGILNRHIYDDLLAKEFLPGALPQDIVTVLLCFITFILIKITSKNSFKLQTVIIGIIGSFFYLYGIFTIERIYNSLYAIYLAIFAFSFWSTLYSLTHLQWDNLETIKLPLRIVRVSAIFGLLIAILFSFLWISALIPLMREHLRIENLYSIYILDLCFVMPAFFITSIITLRKRPLGIIFLPAVYVMGFFVIFPLGLNEIAKPFYGQAANYPSMGLSFVFSIMMLTIGLLHLKNINKQS